ncbi:MAG TPA: hypothetical protein VHM90_11985 [Phycisphaerae bacterium]|nr:hypothetical protein [Phycisphaerae bacterium]
MTRAIAQSLLATPVVRRYTGHVTYIFGFDISYELDRGPIPTLLGAPLTLFQLDSNKRAPRQIFFHRPQAARLPPVQRQGPAGPITIERQIKLFSVGGVSIAIRVPFTVGSITELVDYHDLTFAGGKTVHEEAIALAEEARRELAPHLIRPVEKLAPEEAYTVFCITSPLDTPEGNHITAEDWLESNRRQVAALLTEERDISHLSDQEAEESTSRYLSYYDHDMVVVDWDAALIVDESRYVDEMVYLMELANLQLAELEAYDRMLDAVLDDAYRDLTASASLRGMRQGKSRKTLKDLRELRIDLARLSDELSNITKFFGDWHLARIYQALAARFHLADWHRNTDEKLKTLGELYQLLQADRNNRIMLVLEVTIVLLFVVDLLILFIH